MKQKIKKSLALLLTLAMCLSLFPVGALAVEEDLSAGLLAGASYTLVKNIADLSPGDNIIIATAGDKLFALGAQSGNFRGKVDIIKNGESIAFVDGVTVLALEAGTAENTFSFKAENGYLRSENTGNNMKAEEIKTVASSWAVTIAEDGTASIVSQGSGASKVMQYNATSPRFSCYVAATQTQLSIYKGGPAAPVTQVATPVAAPGGGVSSDKATAVATGTEVTLTCATENAKIYYTTATDGSEPATPTKESTEYTAPIAITEATGIKAIAVDPATEAPLTDSDVLTGYYTVATQITIAEARAKAPDATVAVEGAVTFTDGRNVVIQDSTAGIFIDFSGGATIAGTPVAVGDVLSVTGTMGNYSDQLQLTGPVATRESTGATLPVAVEKTIDELLVCPNTLEGSRVTLTGALLGTVDTSRDTVVSVEGKKISLYKVPALDASIYPGCTVTVTGVLGRFGTSSQLRVTNKTDVVLVNEPTTVANPTPSVASGESLKAGDKVTFTCITPSATIQYNTTSAADSETWLPVPDDGITMPSIVGDYTVYVRATKAEKTTSDVLTLTYSVGRAAMVAIAEARKVVLGEQVFIKGIIVGDTGSSFYVQDATAGVCVNAKLTDLTPAKLGDEVTVRAYVAAPFNGLFQLGKKDDNPITVAVTNDSPTPVTPANVSVAMLNTGFYESQLVKLTGVTLSTHGGTGLQNHTVKQGDASLAFRANLSASFAQGAILDIVGVASTYNTVQLIQQKRVTDNGVTVGTPDPGTVGDPVERAVVWSAGSGLPVPDDKKWRATSGMNAVGAELTAGGSADLAATTGQGYSSTKWDGGAGTKYWQVKFSTKGLTDVAVSSYHRSSKTGPANFQMMYSVDGNKFFTLPGGEIHLVLVGDDGRQTVSGLALPPDMAHKEAVYIRWVLTDTTAVNGAVVGSGGANQINGIIISGNEYYGPGDVAPVKGTPSDANTVKLDTAITLTSASKDATIYYSVDGSEPTTGSTVYSAPIVLATLPTTIKTFAKLGDKQTATKTLEYTQTKLGDVACNKMDNSSISPTLDRITLTAEKGATIQYRITETATSAAGSGAWVDYTVPIALTAEQFPLVLEAKAVATGCLDSEISTFRYTLSAGEPQNYFGQLHAHTSYSDGAGTLENALAYAKNTASQNNVQFVSFTDHSNYFDGAALGGVNPADALYDMTKAPEAARDLWAGYKKLMTDFNAVENTKVLALAGFEMTWSGGPGHINTFNTPGIVSRNNADLNDKSNTNKDLGMQNYYALLSRPEGANSISQFNHPGTTFGTFTEFSYWNPIIDQRMALIEVGNGEGAIGSGGYYPSYGEYTKALDKGWHVAPTNNQDNHKGGWGDANTARSVVYTNDFSEQGLYQAMKDRRVYATEDKNLNIVYTVNDMIMGSTITTIPATLSVKGVITDPDANERISKVELIVNGGRVLKSWESIDSNSYTAEATFTKAEIADYSYFYLRVTQADKDIAVSAPVWVGSPVLTGVASLVSGTAMPVIGEPIEFATSVFNNEETGAVLTSISYDVKGGAKLHSSTPGTAIPSMGSADHKFSYTPNQAGVITVEVTAVITVGGKSHIYTQSLGMTILDPATMPYIGIDGSHFNEYVAGNYKDSMGNFGLLAFSHNTRTNILKTSADLIAACSNPKYKMLVLTAPSRRNGTALRDPYATYNDAEIKAIQTFAENGGTIVVAGWADYYENYGTFPTDESKKDDHMAAQQNKLLAAIGSTLRISDDECLDDVHNSTNTAANNPRLYLSNYNFENPLTNGIVFDPDHIFDGQNNIYTQVFSQYGGTTIYAVDGEGNPTNTLPASVSPIVSGFDTTYSADKDGDSLGGVTTPKYSVTQGKDGAKNCVMVAASETLTHANGKTSLVVTAGGAFMSNFEIQADAPGDNNAVLGYSNYNILENLIELVNPPVITNIAAVQAAPAGQTFSVEGLVTANASGFDKTTAFFDCTYIQDATGGVNVFPVSGNYQIGQKLRITGVTSSYQGERQLAVTSVKMLDSAPATVEPKVVTTKQAATGAVVGQLIKIEGVVVSFAENQGTIETIVVRDSSGHDARIFIDGYITTAKDAALRTNLAVGNKITAVGLASYDNAFDGAPNRIRIRDRGDIVCTTEKPELPAGTSYATITIPPTGFATGMAGAEDDAFMREGVVLADPIDTGALAVTGTLAYKSGFTGFWPDNAAMQEGNFLGLRLTLPNYPGLTPVLTYGEKVITVPDGHTVANNNPYYDFIQRIDPAKPSFTIIVDLDGDGTAYTPTTYTFGLAGLTLNSKPSSGGSTGGGSTTVRPGDVKESDTSVEVKLPSANAKLNAAASEKVVAANATKPVELTGPGLKVTIPAGTLSKGADVNTMVVNPKDKGNVIQVTKPDGTTVILPFAAVGGGNAAYLANVEGTYKIIDNIKTFPDTTEHWAVKAIDFATSHEFFKGTDDGTFRPELPMTRGMLVTVLARIDGGKTAEGSAFVDVPATAWYAREVAWAAQNKLVEGNGISFDPDGSLTREQLCVILARYLVYSGLTLSETTEAGTHSDLNTVSPWAADAMQLAIKTGLISGKSGGLLDPQGQASRAEIATILQRFVTGVLQ